MWGTGSRATPQPLRITMQPELPWDRGQRADLAISVSGPHLMYMCSQAWYQNHPSPGPQSSFPWTLWTWF